MGGGYEDRGSLERLVDGKVGRGNWRMSTMARTSGYQSRTWGR
jgi:hypothetical protein